MNHSIRAITLAKALVGGFIADSKNSCGALGLVTVGVLCTLVATICGSPDLEQFVEIDPLGL